MQPFKLLILLTLGLSTSQLCHARTQSVTCHYTYGGETKDLVAHPVESPYEVPVTQVGSYFLLRVVWQTKTSPVRHAAVNIYTYADGNDGAVIIHQAEFPYPLSQSGRYGFTGLQRVYEPMRDGELLYWCEADASTSRKARR